MPRWVRLRRIGIGFTFCLTIALIIAASLGWEVAPGFLWIIGLVLAPFFLYLDRVPGVLRFISARFPRAIALTEAWIDRMQFHLDWDEQRR